LTNITDTKVFNKEQYGKLLVLLDDANRYKGFLSKACQKQG